MLFSRCYVHPGECQICFGFTVSNRMFLTVRLVFKYCIFNQLFPMTAEALSSCCPKAVCLLCTKSLETTWKDF